MPTAHRFGRTWAGGACDEHHSWGTSLGLGAVTTDHVREMTDEERSRVFNLAYYTWVEQQGVPVEEFEARRRPAYWRGLRDLLGAWDELIVDFNARVAKG